MSRITEILDLRANEVIQELNSKFTTRLFIWKLMDSYEVDYVDMLVEAYNLRNDNPKIFHNLHSQIGRYLLNNKDNLQIENIGEIKEPDINPFGRETPTQCWRKL